MDINEKIDDLERRIKQLESAANPPTKPGKIPGLNTLRMVDDGRGRGVVVSVGGNN